MSRFAPSPTGYLHLGHAYSAQFAFEVARASGGKFRLRIENIDQGRCRDEFERGIIEDLRWLGLHWDLPPRRQSDHMDLYNDALNELDRLGVIYPCFCTRRGIRAEIAHANQAPHGPGGEPVYPGICRDLSPDERLRRIQSDVPYALRLNVARAKALTGELMWRDMRAGLIKAEPELFGDVVLARKDVRTSYHLAVTVDDSEQSITLVTRGEDLYHATHIHRLLQALLGLRTPRYYHHNLIVDANGQRMSKRNGAVTIRSLRESGYTPDAIWDLIHPPEAARASAS